MSEAAAQPEITTRRKFSVLGVNVDAVQIPEVIERMESWIAERNGSHFIAVTGMHGVTEAQRDPASNGMPLVWLGRRGGMRLRGSLGGSRCSATGTLDARAS